MKLSTKLILTALALSLAGAVTTQAFAKNKVLAPVDPGGPGGGGGILPIDPPGGGGGNAFFKHPHIGKRLADGCFSWPGPCNSSAQANAFCQRKGFSYATSYNAYKQIGTFSTRRLGDGGVCRLACTVLKNVSCQ